MKKVMTGLSLQEKMLESVDYLVDIVKTTLGPQGRNVLIDHSMFSPFVTNDGATIAQNIESEDAVINTILEITKEASLKTDEIVGDGTTTTLVLLQSLFHSCLKQIQAGKSPMILKKEMNHDLQVLIDKLARDKSVPNQKHLLSIARIAAKDEEIGTMVASVFERVKHQNAITIKEVSNTTLKVLYLTGYQCAIELASDYFLREQKSLSLSQAHVLIVQDLVSDLEPLHFILNDCMADQKSLVLLAHDFDEQVVKEMVSLNLEKSLTCVLFKVADYGLHQRKIEKDLEVLTNAKIVLDYPSLSLENLGRIEEITFTQNEAILKFEKTPKINHYFSLLKEESKNLKSDFEIDFYQKRMAMIQNGLAEIWVGAPTKTEGHEKKMRIMDALGAINSANEGVLLGGGVALIKVAHELEGLSPVSITFKEALEAPFKQILLNAGLDVSSIQKEIENSNFEKVYNVNLEKMEEKESTTVLDPFSVLVNSLIHATSIATMLFTTSSLVINEHDNHLNKTNEYTEI